jgi:hypothetical protein
MREFSRKKGEVEETSTQANKRGVKEKRKEES